MNLKLTTVLATAALALALTACGDDETTTVAPVTTTVTEQPTSTTSTSTTSTTADTTSSTATSEDGEDVSGNCDEAEHADDPECSGGVAAPDDD